MPGSITMCCWRAGRAELLDILAELDTLTPKSLRLNNNILAPCLIVKEFVSALHQTETHDPERRSALVFRSQNLCQVQGRGSSILCWQPVSHERHSLGISCF